MFPKKKKSFRDNCTFTHVQATHYRCTNALSFKATGFWTVNCAENKPDGPSSFYPGECVMLCLWYPKQIKKIYFLTIKFPSFNIWYFIFVLFFNQIELQTVCKSLYSVYINILHSVPTFMEMGLYMWCGQKTEKGHKTQYKDVRYEWLKQGHHTFSHIKTQISPGQPV